MTSPTTEEIVQALDSNRWGVIGEAQGRLMRTYGLENLISAYVAAFPLIRAWQGRKSILFWLLHFARTHSEIVALARRALTDRAAAVRSEACGVLAYSLQKDAVEDLRALLKDFDGKSKGPAAAAIDAITHQNHHYFYDRDHSGNTHWVVNESDRPPPMASKPAWWTSNRTELIALGEQGDICAQFKLADAYHFGYRGTTVDPVQAFYWYRKCAESGDREAQYVLGECYEAGRGVARDFELAAHWYRQAIDGRSMATGYLHNRDEIYWNGSAAPCGLGGLHERGQGVKKDYAQALHWYGEAARLGNHVALHQLGLMYLNGLGIEPDPARARAFLQRSADAGYTKAKTKLKKLSAGD